MKEETTEREAINEQERKITATEESKKEQEEIVWDHEKQAKEVIERKEKEGE